MSRGRWHVCEGGYPHGWDDPVLVTDDAAEAVRKLEELRTANAGRRFWTAAIFDDAVGEGEALDADEVLDRTEAMG